MLFSLIGIKITRKYSFMSLSNVVGPLVTEDGENCVLDGQRDGCGQCCPLESCPCNGRQLIGHALEGYVAIFLPNATFAPLVHVHNQTFLQHHPSLHPSTVSSPILVSIVKCESLLSDIRSRRVSHPVGNI